MYFFKYSTDLDIERNKPPATIGTVLWFRTAALTKLFAAGWRYDDFDDEGLRRGNYLSYAIERIFPYVAQDAGYGTGTVMTVAYAERQMNFLQYATSRIFSEMEAFFPVNNLDDLECYQRNKNKVIEFAKKHGNVYLYGAGKMGRLCAAILRRENVVPEACLVSGDSEVSMLEGIPVVAADVLTDWQNRAVIITVYSSQIQDEIADSLEAYGCRNYIRFWDRQEISG